VEAARLIEPRQKDSGSEQEDSGAHAV